MRLDQTIHYDVDGRRLLTDSLAQTFETPRLFYGTAPRWTIRLYKDDPSAQSGVSPMDLTGVASWAAAVAQDRDLATDPMCRTAPEDAETLDAENGVVRLRLNAKTKSFLAAANGADYGIRAWFELWGFDADGETVLRIDFPIQAVMCVDDGSGGDPVEFGHDPIDPARIQNLDASQIVSGVFDKARMPELEADDVPSLDASKIVSGVFDKARLPELEADDVPSLDASKIVSGVFDKERLPAITAEDIPSLDASKITSGTIDKARLPALEAADVPSLDASKITSGTLEIDAAAMEMLNVGAATITEAEMQTLHANEISATALTAGSASFGGESNTAIIKIGGGTKTSVIGGTFATIGSDSGYGSGRIVIGAGTNASYGYGYLDVGERYGMVTVGGTYGTITVGGGLKTVIRHDAITAGDGTFSRNLTASAGTFSALYGNFVLDASKITSGTISADRLPCGIGGDSGVKTLKNLSETYDADKEYCLLDYAYPNLLAKMAAPYVSGLTNANIPMRIAGDLGLASGLQYISQNSVFDIPSFAYDDGSYWFQFAGILWGADYEQWKAVYRRPVNGSNSADGFYYLYFKQPENCWVVARADSSLDFSSAVVVAKAAQGSGSEDSLPHEGEYASYGTGGISFSFQRVEDGVASCYGELEGCYLYTGGSGYLVHKNLTYGQEGDYYGHEYVHLGYSVWDSSGKVAVYDLLGTSGMSSNIVLAAVPLYYANSGYPYYSDSNTFYEIELWIDNPNHESVTISPAVYDANDEYTPNSLVWKGGSAPVLTDSRIGLLLRAEISDKYKGGGWYHADLYVSRIF